MTSNSGLTVNVFFLCEKGFNKQVLLNNLVYFFTNYKIVFNFILKTINIFVKKMSIYFANEPARVLIIMIKSNI